MYSHQTTVWCSTGLNATSVIHRQGHKGAERATHTNSELRVVVYTESHDQSFLGESRQNLRLMSRSRHANDEGIRKVAFD